MRSRGGVGAAIVAAMVLCSRLADAQVAVQAANMSQQQAGVYVNCITSSKAEQITAQAVLICLRTVKIVTVSEAYAGDLAQCIQLAAPVDRVRQSYRCLVEFGFLSQMPAFIGTSPPPEIGVTAQPVPSGTTNSSARPWLTTRQAKVFIDCLRGVYSGQISGKVVAACLGKARVFGLPDSLAARAALCLTDAVHALSDFPIQDCMRHVGIWLVPPTQTPPTPLPATPPSTVITVAPTTPKPSPSHRPSPSPCPTAICPTPPRPPSPTPLPTVLPTPNPPGSMNVTQAADAVHFGAAFIVGILVGAAAVAGAVRRSSRRKEGANRVHLKVDTKS